MKTFLFTCWLTLCLLPLAAQSTDSLRRVLATMPDDTNRVMLLRQLFLGYYELDQQTEMLDVADQGLTLSKKLHFDKGTDLFLFYKATTLDIMGRCREAIPLYEEGLKLAQKQGDQKAVAGYYVNLGTAFHTLGQLDQALANDLAAYELFKNLDLKQNLSKVLNNIAIIYRNQGKPDRAEAIYKESLAIKETLRDTLGMAVSFQNLASLINTHNRENEAFDYLQKALHIFENLGRKNDAASCYAAIGQLHINFGKIQAAKEALLKAKQQSDLQPSPEYSANVYQLLGKVAAEETQLPAAIAYYHQAEKLARQFGRTELLWTILKEKAQIQAQTGNHKAAFLAMQEAFSIRDAEVETSRLKLMEEMQVKFDVAQKDNELKINQLSLKQRTLERNWLIGGAALLGLLSLVIFFGLRSRMKANKKIAAQESALQKQQILQLEQAAQLAALNAMLEGEEKERTRIAGDLHDSLGGLLAAAKAHFNALPTSAENQELSSKTNRLLDDAAVEVRRISHNMMPRALAVSGLNGALEDLVQHLEKQGLACTLETIGLDAPIEPGAALMVYRIIQELSNNVVKHAAATQLLLQIIRSDQQLTIILEDNGKGFDLEQARLKKGLGLASIESRVQFLQGNINWDSEPGAGTTVSIEVPVSASN